MRILGIETSCDETSASIIEGQGKDKKVKLLSNVVSSSIQLHTKTGGIIPENAAREQIKYIIPVIEEALLKGVNFTFKKNTDLPIDAIAVTHGPGLIGSLLVGVETAKTLSFIFNKPLIPTNHLLGHIYANFIEDKNLPDIKFPALALIVSGGHTDLLFIKNHDKITWLGGTRDDAAGEALDKIGRLLNLPYPGGPSIESQAKNGNPKAFYFPRPMLSSKDLDFSFSGLKTSVLRKIKEINLDKKAVRDISSSVQEAIIEVLVKKTIKASVKYNAKSILLGGGVSANQKLRDEFNKKIKEEKLDVNLLVPPKFLCTDNAAMIAAFAFYHQKPIPWQKVSANPELNFE